MKRTMMGLSALALAAGLAAYGVSPSQYSNGRAQDAANTGIPNAPMPNPVPGNAVAPGAQPFPGAQPQIQLNQPGQPSQPQNYDAMAVPDWAKEWKHYKWEEAKAHWESRDALFIDARGKNEYDQAHIPGAIPMPMGEFDQYYAKYEKKIKAAKYLVTYCHGVGCQLSNKVAQKLWNDKKLHNVGSFFGGWPQWQQHNMPVETGPEPKR